MRSLFGWDYPPGVSSLPWDEPWICEICGGDEDTCICPECPICGEYGDPNCYFEHGMRRTEEQKFSLECSERELDDYVFQRSKYEHES
jgi:hypothetical protein